MTILHKTHKSIIPNTWHALSQISYLYFSQFFACWTIWHAFCHRQKGCNIIQRALAYQIVCYLISGEIMYITKYKFTLDRQTCIIHNCFTDGYFGLHFIRLLEGVGVNHQFISPIRINETTFTIDIRPHTRLTCLYQNSSTGKTDR